MKYNISEMLAVIPFERRRLGLMKPEACKMSDVRHLGNLLSCASGSVALNIQENRIKRGDSILSSMATVITKPFLPGERTSIVVRSRHPELEGLIVKDGLPLRYLRNDAVYPEFADDYLNNEGRLISQSATELGVGRFGINEPIFHLFPLIFIYLNISVGPSFYDNIELFTQHMNKSK